jgi:hypothetical protein
MNPTIFVEGAFDRELIAKLLGDLRGQYPFRLHAGRGLNALRPLARKSLVVDRSPVALVVDAESIDRDLVAAQKRDLEDYLAWGASGVPFKVIQFVPEAEVIFFEQQGFLQRVLKRRLTPSDVLAGKVAPRRFLDSQFAVAHRSRTELLRKLGVSEIVALRAHPQVQELREFVKQVPRTDGVQTLAT